MGGYCLRYLMVASTSAFLLAVTIPAFAQTPPVQVKSATTSEQGEGKGRGTRSLIAQVFGEQLYLEQFTPPEADAKRKELTPEKFHAWLFEFQAARVYDKDWGSARKKYIEKENLGVTKEELDAIVRSVELQMMYEPQRTDIPGLGPAEAKGIRVALTHASLIDWKVCKSLHEKYGGRVGIGSLGSWTALDGQFSLMQEHLKAGDIRFHHVDLENAVWKYAQRERFADAYPVGDSLKRLLRNPPHLQALQNGEAARPSRSVESGEHSKN